jgi:hypothetical protein
MKQHTTDLLGQFRKAIQRIFAAGAGRTSRRTPRLAIEPLEDRRLLAASFFAPAEPTGSVNVQLVPLADVTPGSQEIVTFGMPFTRGSVSQTQLSQIRVLKNGVEVPAFVEQLTPWRSIDDPALDGQSVRVARIQIPYTFTSLNPESITVQWGGPTRTLSRTTMQDPRIEWHTVTSGSFVAADNVQEPDVLPVLPKDYLALGMLDSQTQPTANGVAATRDDPAVMNSMTFPGYTEYDYAEKNFFYTTINQNGSTPIDYKTQPEPWLYDRSSGMYELYMHSGFATALREAVQSTDFYVNHLDSSGFFTLKPGDPKYSYNESLAYTYWLLGDNRMLAPISTVVNAFDGTATHWTPDLSFWTERNSGDKLLATEVAYEVTGNDTFKNNVQTIVGDFIWHQNGANGQLPSTRVDGGLYHYGVQHDLSEVSSPNVLVASSWMSALIVDPMVRVYGVWEDNAQIPDFIIRMGNFEKVASQTDADGQFGGITRYPDYLMRPDGVPDNRSSTDVQHAMDVGAVAAWATYFDELRGTPDPSLRQLANDLYTTYDLGVHFWTSTSDGYTVLPPRRYNWEYKNSPSFSWALTAADAPGQAGMLHFSATTYGVVENQGTATITVTRTGGSTGSVSVHYATSDGTATAGSDYTATAGTLTFADGETSKTFAVPIINDTAVENKETVILTLSNPTGGAALDSPATATLTIDSDDTTTQPVTLTYQQGVNGYTGTTDLDVSNQYVTNGATNLTGDQLGVYQVTGTGGYTIEGMIRFDNLGITTHATTDATVTSASLTLTVDFGTTAPTIRGYYLLAPWTTAPGTDLGWVRTGAGASWNIPGARGQGTDVVAGKSFVLPSGTGTQTVTVPLDPTVVQNWIDNPNADQGILLVNETTGAVVRVDASENATTSARPKLSISYTVGLSMFPGALQFSNATYSVNENGGTATITVTRTGGSTGSVSVNYATSDGTATAGSDYTATAGTLTFADGETSKTFTIPILDDNLVENNETINLALSNPTGGAALGSPATAAVTIVDNDVPQPGVLQFSTSAYSVIENQGTATITVTRTGGSNVPVSVSYATSDGTATAGADYTATSGTLNFAIGETSKTFTIPILDDKLVEGNETVNLTLSSPTGGATLGTPTTAILTIVDDDTSGTIAVAFQQGVNGYTGTTDVSISTQYAQYTGGNGTTTFDGTDMGVYQTKGKGSYITESLIRFSSLGIPTNAMVVSATLTLNVYTWTANPTIRGYYLLAPWNGTPGSSLGWLHRGTGQDWATPGALGQGTDDVAGKSFLLSGITASGSQTITVTLDPTVVQTWINNPSADQGILLVNKTPGAIVQVSASENPTVAARPKLSINYTSSSSPGALQFSNATYSVNENGGTATITVTRTGGSTGSVSVNYATSDGTATAGKDYTATAGTLTFADGETSKTFTIPILDDNLVEGNETVNLTLSSPTGGAALGSQATATLTIVDDDVATLQSISVAPVNPSVPAGQTAQLTATGHFSDGSSHVLTSGVSWSSSNTSIATIAPSGLASAVAIGSTTITAVDGSFTDSTTLTVTAAPTSPTVGAHTLAFTHFGAPAGTLSTNPLTTQASGSTVLAWVGRGQISTFTSATAPLDNLGNTSIQLGSTHSYAPLFPNSGMALYAFPSFAGGSGDIFSAPMPVNDEVTLIVVEIKNGGVIQDSEWNSVVNDPQTSLSVTTTGPATLIAFWTGDAGSGTVSAVPNNGFTVLDSQTDASDAVQASVATKDVSAAGTYNVTWSATPAQTAYMWLVAVQHGAPAPQPGKLQLSSSNYSVTENGGTAAITVTRTGGSDGAVSVNYATSDGTATAGSDYTATSGTLNFAAGETSKTFTVPILDDTLVEGNETVNLTLSSPTGGAALGNPTSATLTIVDNDSPPTGAFTDVTDSSGISAIIAQKYKEDPNWWLSGEHLVDLDNDGHLDLFLDAHNGTSVVALNDGHGVFTRVTTGSWPSTEIHEMFDINGDGKVDLNATYQDGGSQWWINNSTPGHVNFTPTSVTRGTNTSREQVLFDFNGDGNVDWFRSAPPGLEVDFGDGKGNFTEGSLTFTIPGTDSNNNANFLPGDFDGDGKTDLLILTGGGYDGTLGKTMVWHNNGNMSFTDVTASSGLPTNGFVAKGVGDFNQDGSLDIIGIQNKSMPPLIYLNDGHGHFTLKPNAISGVAPESLDYTAWGTAIVTDVDNDGIADIIMDGKYYLKVLRGTGGGNFTYMNTAWGIKDTAASSVDDGLCFGDIDGDGRLDIIGYNETYPTRTITVYHNDLAPQNWLNIRPVGLAGNVGAAGAKILIYAPGTTQLLWEEQVAIYDFQVATSYYGYNETERHFGLGSLTNVDVVVVFASGQVTRVNNVAANQTIRVLEGPGS